MSASITSSVCALCRRPLPVDEAGSSATRLCDSCRKMVDNIRPSASRGATGPTPSAPTQQCDPMQATQTPSPQTSNSNIAGSMPPQEPLPNPAWAAGPPPEPQPHPVRANTPSQEPVTKSGLNTAPRQAPPANIGWSHEPPANPVWSDVVMVPSGPDSREAPFQSSTGESAYHQNWPIMVEEATPQKRRKGILVMVLLVVMAGAAAVTFFVFKDTLLGSRGGPAAGPTSNSSNKPVAATEPKAQEPKSVPAAAVQDSAKPVTPGPSQSPGAGTSPAPAVASASVDFSKPPQATPPAQVTQTPQGAHTPQAAGAKTISLQAASFPNEASAKQVQDRLIQAGLPAYVVAADIPHRGKWYRVRAGKFATQEEARQAAESWRKRLGAAGINMQLVPCDY